MGRRRGPALERAVTNLLDNAAKWSPPDGTVTVRLADGVLTVDDEGPGISDEDLPHVFDRFYRAEESRSMPGSGLGLSIVRQVVERHAGVGRGRARARRAAPGSPSGCPDPPRRPSGPRTRRTRSRSDLVMARQVHRAKTCRSRSAFQRDSAYSSATSECTVIPPPVPSR